MASSTGKTSKPKSTTTRRKSTPAKAKSAPTPEPAAPATVVDPPKAVVLGPMMRKPELVNAVVAKSGMKKKDVKPIVEATLAVLGAALQDSRELNLQPMGKIKVNREKKKPNGKVMIARIRQSQDLPSEDANPDPKDMGDTAAPPTAAE
ncbi:HU family DNA-binding protein [Tateyamaria armeniaca]|uniref:HU family DNA-binding protein n=1 Tax=Tateyamaria armeniaca TaxID=2518930 RepID=A0ABW8UZI1_9RHOB